MGIEHNISVLFDLETTGLGNCDIISIGAIAVDSSNGEEVPGGRFEGYMMPTAAIQPGASRVNGFTKEDGLLCKHGIPVEKVEHPQQVLQNFVNFLYKMDNRGDGQIDLVAHNAFGFDGPVLSNNFRKFDVQYGTSIRYILDTVEVARKYSTGGSAKLSNLMNQFLHEGAGDVQSHEALKDTEDLLSVARAMATKRGITFAELLDMSPKREFYSMGQ